MTNSKSSKKSLYEALLLILHYSCKLMLYIWREKHANYSLVPTKYLPNSTSFESRLTKAKSRSSQPSSDTTLEGGRTEEALAPRNLGVQK